METFLLFCGYQDCSSSRDFTLTKYQALCRETLSLAAQLRLSGTKSSPEDRQQAVDDLIQRLGLSTSADTNVGNAKTRYCSL